MAIIYYVKSGPRPGNSGPGYEVPLSNLEIKVRDQRVRYLGTTPPEFNKDSSSQYPLHVIVEIDSKESLGRMFNKVGFFLLELSPEEAHKMIFQGTTPPFKL